MPFVNIRIVKEVLEDAEQQKAQISQRVTDAISEVVGIPKEAIWVVFEDITDTDWYVGATSVQEMRKESQ